MRKMLVFAAVLSLLMTPAVAGKVRNDYTPDEQLKIMQGVAGVGVLAHCENSDYYASKVGPVAFERISLIFGTIGGNLEKRAYRVFTRAREDGRYPLKVKDASGAANIEWLQVTDEAGCIIVEDDIKKLMETGGLFDVTAVPEQDASQ